MLQANTLAPSRGVQCFLGVLPALLVRSSRREPPCRSVLVCTIQYMGSVLKRADCLGFLSPDTLSATVPCRQLLVGILGCTDPKEIAPERWKTTGSTFAYNHWQWVCHNVHGAVDVPGANPALSAPSSIRFRPPRVLSLPYSCTFATLHTNTCCSLFRWWSEHSGSLSSHSSLSFVCFGEFRSLDLTSKPFAPHVRLSLAVTLRHICCLGIPVATPVPAKVSPLAVLGLIIAILLSPLSMLLTMRSISNTIARLLKGRPRRQLQMLIFIQVCPANPFPDFIYQGWDYDREWARIFVSTCSLCFCTASVHQYMLKLGA